jgi:hypothetical protein
MQGINISVQGKGRHTISRPLTSESHDVPQSDSRESEPMPVIPDRRWEARQKSQRLDFTGMGASCAPLMDETLT